MGILNGQAVNEAITNPAFLFKNADDVMMNKLGFARALSGASIADIQQAVNNIYTATGVSESANGMQYDAPINTIDNDISHEEALSTLAGKFAPATGHTHDGTDGNGGPIEGSSIINVPLIQMPQKGSSSIAASGGTEDVTSLMTGFDPSTDSTTPGVVVNDPENRVYLLQDTGTSTGDLAIDENGDVIYGRLTESSGTWTLTYYTAPSGVETPYSFPVSTDLQWYYTELFEPLTSTPVYQPLFELFGKGVHSIAASGYLQSFGDVTLLAGAYTYASATGNVIEIGSTIDPALYAFKDLSNLTPTAINVDLIPDTDEAYDLGSASLKWKDLYLSGSTIYLGALTTITGSTFQTVDTVSGASTAYTVKTGNTTDNAISSGTMTVKTGDSTGGGASTGAVTVKTGDRTGSGGGATGAMTIQTGDASTSGGTQSGAMTIKTGSTPVGGTAGTITIVTGSSTSGASGAISYKSGDASTGTGTVTIASGAASGGASGSVSISSGSGSTGSGAVNFSTGASTGSSTGDLNFTSGNSSVAASGDINFTTGTAGTSRGRVRLNGRVVKIGASAAADPSSPETGDVYFNTVSLKFRYYDGTTWNDLGAGSGSGGSGSAYVKWFENGTSPTPSIEYSTDIYTFQAGLGQQLFTTIQVPNGYTAGSQIFLQLGIYSSGTSGDLTFKTTATLVRSGVDALSSTTNQEVYSFPLDLSTTVVDSPNILAFEITDASGEINGVAVSPNDMIKITFNRDSADTATADGKLISDTSEIVIL